MKTSFRLIYAIALFVCVLFSNDASAQMFSSKTKTNLKGLEERQIASLWMRSSFYFPHFGRTFDSIKKFLAMIESQESVKSVDVEFKFNDINSDPYSSGVISIMSEYYSGYKAHYAFIKIRPAGDPVYKEKLAAKGMIVNGPLEALLGKMEVTTTNDGRSWTSMNEIMFEKLFHDELNDYLAPIY